MRRHKRYAQAVGGLLISGLATTSILGDTIKWDGGAAGTQTNWSNTASWAGDLLPTAIDDVVFDSTAVGGLIGTPIRLNADVSIRTLTFDTNVPDPLNIDGNNNAANPTRVLTIGGDGTSLITLTGNVAGTVRFRPNNNGIQTVLSQSGEVRVESGGANLIFNGDITSPTAIDLTKAGAGQLTLLGATNLTGTLAVVDGRLQVRHVGAVQGLSSISSGTLGGTTAQINIDIAGTTPEAPVTLLGSGQITVNGAGGYNNGTSVVPGALRAGGDTWVIVANNVAFAADSVIAVAGPSETVGSPGSSLNLAGVLSGSGFGYAKEGTGVLTLSGSAANSYSGTTTVNAGTLQLAKTGGATAVAGNLLIGNALDALDVVQLGESNQIADPANVQFVGGGTTAGVLRLNGRLETVAGISSVSGEGIIENGGEVASTFTVGGTGNSSFGGTLQDGGAAGLSLVKSGAGVLELTGESTYTGGTTVTGGTLLVNNTTGSALGGGDLTVAGVLGGSGTIGSAADAVNVTVASGGSIAPGNSAGTLTIHGGLSLLPGSSLAFELNGTTAGLDYDQLVVDGPIDLGGAALNLLLGYTPSTSDVLTLINNVGGSPINGVLAGLPNLSTVNLGGSNFQINYAGGDGNDLVLSANPVPEPSTLALGLVSGIAAIVFGWFRSKRQSRA